MQIPGSKTFVLSAILVLVSIPSFAGQPQKPVEKADKGTDEEAAIKGLKLAAGLKAELWTSNKQVINPVAISFDDQNRMYLNETHRFRDGGGLDIREHSYMFLDDMLCVTTDDRRKLYEKYKTKFKPGYFTTNKERILILEDTLGKGKSDKTTVFAEAFNDELDGPAVGVLWHNNKVYFPCLPKIWELDGATGSTPASKMSVMFDGFGVRVGISGHDLHATIIGPDGKLYWSLGDRGYNVTGKEGQRFVNPHSGGVFRSNLDGSELEQFYFGLRNPQELAFDDFGNLFTCDNNADIGDSSRLTYILEGGSSGWTAGWQLLGYKDFGVLGGVGGKKPDPWLEEGMWKLRFDTQPAHILPPAGHLTSGPVGMTFNPGVGSGLPDSYARHFFVCDYTSGAASGVHSCLCEESGAGFVMKDAAKFVWGITATDVEFGYDGRVYVVDYGGGWHLPGKGSVIAISDPEAIKNPKVAEVRKLIGDGIGTKSTPELGELLKHSDMRARLHAQFELAKRGKDGLAVLTNAAKTAGEIHGRVHGIWGLGQLAKQEPDAVKTLIDLLADPESRVREQAAKLLGDIKAPQSADALLKLLTDSSPRVKTFAAISLGKLKNTTAITPLIAILRENADKDAFVRHGAVMGLVGANDASALRTLATDASKSVRLGAVLALRRMGSPEVAAFLKDVDPQVYIETVRAIYDAPILGAMPQLASEIKRIAEKPADFKAMPTLYYARVLNANYRYGNADNAPLIAEFAAAAGIVPEGQRIAALDMLVNWEQPSVIDHVLGLPRAVEKRAKLQPNDVIKNAIKKILTEDGQISARAVDIAFAFGVDLNDAILLSYVKNDKRGEDLRAKCIQQLAQRKNNDLPALLPKLSTEKNLTVRIAALGALLEFDPAAGITAARAVLDDAGSAKSETLVVIERAQEKWKGISFGGPSNNDYADANSKNGAEFSSVKGFGMPNVKAGAVDGKLPRLNDGISSENDDDIDRNVWIDNPNARMVLDLKKSIDVAAVNTFSWHLRDRALQKFTLWGSDKEKADPAAKELKTDWTEIANVDTASLKEGGQHASSIYNPAGSLGKFRYLLWQSQKKSFGTFFSEIDVYEKGKWNYTPSGTRRDQQQVLAALGASQAPAVDGLLSDMFDKFIAGKISPTIQLDVLEAAQQRKEEKLAAKVAEYKKKFGEEDKLGPFMTTLQGGDAKVGQEIFQVHAAGCLKCHKLGEAHDAGSDAGPRMTGVGTRLTRDKILESLIDPSAVIVEGFGAYTFKMEDGTIVTGSITSEDANEVIIKLADGKSQKLPVAEIKKRSKPVSPMPTMAEVLKPREIRDLIEYLSSLK